MPKVSICIPAYNQPVYLRKTIESALMQDYTDYEIILTDDSNNNDVKNLVVEFDSKKITYFKNEKSLGSPANWNFAVSKAKGEYIKILHHDDFFNNKGSLGEFVKALDDNKNAAFAFCQTTVFDEKKDSLRTHAVNEEQFKPIRKHPELLITGNRIGAPSATIYKKQDVFFDENLKWLVDTDFYIQLLQKNNKAVIIQKPLITTTDGAIHQVTRFCLNNPEVEIKEYTYELEKYSFPPIKEKEFTNFFLKLFFNYKITSLKELHVYAPFVKKQLPFFKKILKQFPSYSKRTKLQNNITAIFGRVFRS